MPMCGRDRDLLGSTLSRLEALGIRVLGRLRPRAADLCQLLSGLKPPQRSLQLLLLGNIGALEPRFWEQFSLSPEAHDGKPNPMNRWTQRVVEQARDSERGSHSPIERIVYPFQGPPYWPFQRWAMQAGCGETSRLGPLIHPEYGTWFAFRAALLVSSEGDRANHLGDVPSAASSDASDLSQHRREHVPELAALSSLCAQCQGQPCVSACPAGAFDHGRLDVKACRSWLAQEQGKRCIMGGCQARARCPIAAHNRYSRAQCTFHMRAFNEVSNT